MSDTSNDDGYKVGKGKPPREHQFQPGVSGNKGGRRPKRKPILVPTEIRRTILKVLDEKVEINSPVGPKKVTLFEAILRFTLTGAAKGNPTQLRLAMKLITDALYDRIDAHKAVWLTEALQNIQESAHGAPDPLLRDTIKDQLRTIKHRY